MVHKRKWFGWGMLGLLLALVVAGGSFVWWANDVPVPTADALRALEANAEVEVVEDRWLIFHPAAQDPSLGFIIYPGGRVDARAYATVAQQIASDGFLVVIVPMPLNLAITNANAATEVMAAYPQIKSWAIGGHSLGGAMAARYAYANPGTVEGLVLWAAYPADSDDLTNREDLVVSSIYGTEDGLATVEKVESSRGLLPPSSSFVAIPGGNHAQFGSYGDQTGDRPASISRAQQQRMVVEATLAVLYTLNETG
jgi:predicted alpha/beta-hydrolase family hydrolase